MIKINKKAIILIFAALLATNIAIAAPIHDAATKGDVEKIKALVGANKKLVNAKDKDGATPLHYAAAKNQAEVAKYLLANGSNINAVKKDGVTPIHVASACKSYDTAAILVSAKAKIDVKDKKGRTALSIAAANEDAQMETILNAKHVPQPNIKPAISQQASDKQIKLTEKFISLVSNKEYKRATDMFDDTMKQAFSADKLQALWENALTAQTGPFKELKGVEKGNVDDIPVVYATCVFEKLTVKLQIAYNSADKISGIYIVGSE